MIIKLLKKIVSYFFLAIAIFGNTGWFSLLKTKEFKNETPAKNQNFTFKEALQCRPTEKTFDYKPEILSWKNPAPSSLYRSYNGQNHQNETPQSGHVAFFINATSSSSVVMTVTNFDYITDPTHTIINEIRDINIDIVEPKSLLARNLNEEWRENIDFYSDYHDHPGKI